MQKWGTPFVAVIVVGIVGVGAYLARECKR